MLSLLKKGKMERQSLLRNKKGISDMVGYVLLIVIAMGLSVLVFVYLKNFTPTGKLSCPDGISVFIKSAACNSGKLSLSLANNGLFTIDNLYIKMGSPDRNIRYNLNNPEDPVNGGLACATGKFTPRSTCDLSNLNIQAANPNFGSGHQYVLEIQPMVVDANTGKWAICDGTAVSQMINCN